MDLGSLCQINEYRHFPYFVLVYIFIRESTYFYQEVLFGSQLLLCVDPVSV